MAKKGFLSGTESGRAPVRVLAAASETGSGKAIVPVLLALVGKGAEIRAILPPFALAFAHQLPELASGGNFQAVSGGLSVEDAVDSGEPDAIVVGTTAVDSFERGLTLYAREKNVPTVAVVDERYGYRRRFSDQANELRYLTDAITVMDEQCYEDAVAEGLPKSRLHVTGSPILSHLFYNSSSLVQNSETLAHRFDPSQKQVTFLSETFVRDNGRSPSQPGRLGTFVGFTEETVRNDIIAVLNDIGQAVVLVERMHPSDEQLPKERWMSSVLFWRQVNSGDLWPLLLQSDAVIGMRSMGLLEAALLGCRTASYQPNLIGENKCAAVGFGFAARLETRQQLKDWFFSNLSAETRSVRPPKELPFIRADAADRVADLVLRRK